MPPPPHGGQICLTKCLRDGSRPTISAMLSSLRLSSAVFADAAVQSDLTPDSTDTTTIHPSVVYVYHMYVFLSGFAEEMDAGVLPGDERPHRRPHAQHAGERPGNPMLLKACVSNHVGVVAMARLCRPGFRLGRGTGGGGALAISWSLRCSRPCGGVSFRRSYNMLLPASV